MLLTADMDLSCMSRGASVTPLAKAGVYYGHEGKPIFHSARQHRSTVGLG